MESFIEWQYPNIYGYGSINVCLSCKAPANLCEVIVQVNKIQEEDLHLVI